jgi:hypothetical protein
MVLKIVYDFENSGIILKSLFQHGWIGKKKKKVQHFVKKLSKNYQKVVKKLKKLSHLVKPGKN